MIDISETKEDHFFFTILIKSINSGSFSRMYNLHKEKNRIVDSVVLYLVLLFISDHCVLCKTRRGNDDFSDTVLDGRSQFSDRNLIHACISGASS